MIVRGLAILFASAIAVQAAPEPFEGIAALVDGRPIFRSELMQALYQAQQAGTVAGLSADSARRQVLDRIIDEKVVVARAARDSITVSEQEIKQRVDQQVRTLAVRQRMSLDSLEKAIRMQLGISMAQYREQLSSRLKDQMIVGRVRARHVPQVTPTRKEVESFFQEFRDSIPRQFNCIRLQHIQLKVDPSRKIIDSVRTDAKLLIDSLDKGIAFEVLAKRHSQDGSAQQGGDIGFFRKGALEPEYERAAVHLDLGMYTDQPVKTRLGWHIIRLLAKKDDEFRTSHILLQTVPTVADSMAVKNRADSIRTAVLAGADFATAARQFTIDAQERLRDGDLGWFERAEVDSAYQQVVARLEAGDVSEPILIDGSWNLFRLADARSVRELNLDEDYIRIEEFAANTLASRKLEKLVQKWRREVRIELRDR